MPLKKLSMLCGLRPLTALGGGLLGGVVPGLLFVGGGITTVFPPGSREPRTRGDAQTEDGFVRLALYSGGARLFLSPT